VENFIERKRTTAKGGVKKRAKEEKGSVLERDPTRWVGGKNIGRKGERRSEKAS